MVLFHLCLLLLILSLTCSTELTSCFIFKIETYKQRNDEDQRTTRFREYTSQCLLPNWMVHHKSSTTTTTTTTTTTSKLHLMDDSIGTELSSEWSFSPKKNESAVAKTLAGRLLCASQVSYQTSLLQTKSKPSSNNILTTATTTAPIPNYFKSVQYIQGTTVTRISKSVNSALIGTNVDGIIVAFRGTQTNSPLDWLQNAALLLKTVSIDVAVNDDPTSSETAAATIIINSNESQINSRSSNIKRKRIQIPGKVHSGFVSAVKMLWKPLVQEIRKHIANNENDSDGKLSSSSSSSSSSPPPPIYFCGHSKGGAMASIAALFMNLDPSLPNVTSVYTFASAKPGNSDFRDSYNRMINQTSYESYLDIVPFLPPSKRTMEVMEECGESMKQMMNDILWSDSQARTQYSTTNINFVWDYQSLGKRLYIDQNAKIITNVTKDLDDERIQELENKTLLQIQKFAAAHCSGCPSSTESGGGTCDGFFFRALALEVCSRNENNL